jgi:hypothetical protein
MFGQISLDILLLFMLYATGATTAAIACFGALFCVILTCRLSKYAKVVSKYAK